MREKGERKGWEERGVGGEGGGEDGGRERSERGKKMVEGKSEGRGIRE